MQLPEGNAANAGRNAPDKQFNVNDWNPRNGNGNIGGAPAVVSSIEVKGYCAWWTESSHQAFCLFPVILFVALRIFYLVTIDYLSQAAREFLQDQA